MNKTLLATMLALGITVVSTSAMAFGSTDDNVPGNIHQCRGCDDPVGHIRQGRGADDVGGVRGFHADGHISGRDRVRIGGSNSGRGHGGGVMGGNSGRGHGIGAVGTPNPVGHVRGGGHGADDPVGHIRGGHGADDAGPMGLLGR
jgi:hypothetical protein